tara:strand:+ start:256 stop:720 length:465 start_codon:yes stop_codon:yes gene_type:complete
MRINLQSSQKKESKSDKLKSIAKALLKSELRAVSVTTDNKSFLLEEDAIKHQLKLIDESKKKEKEDRLMSRIEQIIKDVLENNSWGIYFKGEPFHCVPTQDSTKFYKINDIKTDKFLDKVSEKLLEDITTKEQEWLKNKISSKERQTDNESLDG